MASLSLVLLLRSSTMASSRAVIPSSCLHQGNHRPSFSCCCRPRRRRRCVSLSVSAAHDPLFKAALAPSCFGLRTTTTPFSTTTQGPRTCGVAAPLPSCRPVRRCQPVSACGSVFAFFGRALAFYGLRPRIAASLLLHLVGQHPKFDALIFVPLLLRWGVQPSLFPQALLYKSVFLLCVFLFCFVLDSLDLLQEDREWRERLCREYQELLLMINKKREAESQNHIGPGICKPNAGEHANPESQG